MKHKLNTLFSLLLALLLTLSVVGVSSAHEHIPVGPYEVVLGWAIEPVIVGQLNAITIDVTTTEEHEEEGEGEEHEENEEHGEPVEGLESTLDAEISYGGQVYPGELEPVFGAPGSYAIDIIPTVPGQYEVHLAGTIGEETVDLVVEPEEVSVADALQFPQTAADNLSLSNRLAALQTNLTTAYVLGGLGILLGAAGLFMAMGARRKQG